MDAVAIPGTRILPNRCEELVLSVINKSLGID